MTDRSVSLATANVVALVGALPVLAVLSVPFGLGWGWRALADGLVWWADRPLTMLVALVAGVFVHEALHAATWRAVSTQQGTPLPAGSVRLGVNWRALTPYAHCRVPMTARAYRIGAAVPGVALGLLPVAIAWATGSGAWLVFGLLFTLAAGGDALILWLLRDVPSRALVIDHPTQAGCAVLDDPDERVTDERVGEEE